MSPGPRRNLAPFVVALAVGAVVLFLLVGGLASVGRSSGPYHRSIARSFGSQASVVVAQSNTVGRELGQLVSQMPTLQRTELATGLDAVVGGAQAVASDAAGIAAPAPGGPSSADFVAAMQSRATATERLRSAVDGLLSITPGTGTAAPAPVSVDGAIRAITAVGQELVAADRSYRNARSAFAKVSGGSRLPASVWVNNPVLWQAGVVATTVDELSSAPALAPVVDVQIVAVALDPPVLPPAPAVPGQPQGPLLPAGSEAIPPSCTVAVTAVVRNQGSVAVARVPVRASVQPVSGGAPFVVQKTVSLSPSGSVAVTLPMLAVTPGDTYTLTVTLVAPAGQSGPVGQVSGTISVAPFSGSSKLACAHAPAVSP